jgi:hypothetical protein
MKMTEPIKPAKVTIQLSDTLSIDGYMMPNGEFRAGIAGASVLLGYAKNWFNRLRSEAPNKLKALQDGGFTGYVESVVIPRESGTRGASRAQTISLRDLTTLITIEALAGNKRAIALQAAFTLEGLDSRFRDAFQVKQRTPEEKRRFFGLTYDEFLKALAENRAELEELRLPGDDLYYPEETDENLNS